MNKDTDSPAWQCSEDHPDKKIHSPLHYCRFTHPVVSSVEYGIRSIREF